MEPQVLIAGAGAAGLAAARTLTEHGISCLLVEARGRLGGRIWSLADPVTHSSVELGAEFIHGFPPETLKIVDELRLAAYETPDRHAFRASAGSRFRELPDFWERIAPYLEASLPRGRSDCSFQDRLEDLRGPARDKALARSFVEGFHAADPGLLSQLALKRESAASNRIQGDRALRLLSGYGALIEGVYERLPPDLCPLLLDSPVRRIRWEPGAVEATVEQQGRYRTLRARAAIMTPPPGPLADIRFLPEIPDKREAATYLLSGAVLKVVIRFHEPFWERRREPISFVHSTRRQFPTWWSAAPFRWPLLTGWTGGKAAAELASRGPGAVRREACAALAALFGLSRAPIERLIDGFAFHDWQSDPFARGAYGYIRVGGVAAPACLARPLAGTLFFAGEATESTGLGGTVESALHSGRRAAGECLRALGARAARSSATAA